MSQTDPPPIVLPDGDKPAVKTPVPERKKRLGPAFWAGILFGAVCIFLGLVIGISGSRIFPADPAAGPPPAALPEEPPPPAPRPVARAAPPSAQPTAPLPVLPEGEALYPPDTAALEARLAQVEAAQKGTADAAAAALAVSTLTQAAERSQPFVAEIDRAAGALPDSPDLQALRELAAMGAPSRAALAAAFPAAAARAAVAAREPAENAGLTARAAWLFSGMLTVRRTDQFTGRDADAVLARAGRAVDAGALDTAVRELSTLGPKARAAAGPWRADAERRLAIERRLAALRAAAVAGLQRPGG